MSALFSMQSRPHIRDNTSEGVVWENSDAMENYIRCVRADPNYRTDEVLGGWTGVVRNFNRFIMPAILDGWGSTLLAGSHSGMCIRMNARWRNAASSWEAFREFADESDFTYCQYRRSSLHSAIDWPRTVRGDLLTPVFHTFHCKFDGHIIVAGFGRNLESQFYIPEKSFVILR